MCRAKGKLRRIFLFLDCQWRFYILVREKNMLERRTQNHVKHLDWSVLQKYSMAKSR